MGYMKETFFNLEQKYSPCVRRVVNNEFGKKGKLYTVYKTEEYLNNTFIYLQRNGLCPPPSRRGYILIFQNEQFNS